MLTPRVNVNIFIYYCLMFSYVQQLESLKLLTLRGKIKKENFFLLQHFIIQNVLCFFFFFLYLSAIILVEK